MFRFDTLEHLEDSSAANCPTPLRLAIVIGIGIGIGIEITLMTYILLPWLTKHLATWIYPITTRT